MAEFRDCSSQKREQQIEEGYGRLLASMPESPAPEINAEAARTAIRECFAEIEEAIGNLKPGRGFIELASTVVEPDFILALRRRLTHIALSIQRLEDLSRRLLKRLGADKAPLNAQMASSQEIRLVSRLANTWKHGPGGRQKNSAMLNGVIQIRRQDGFKDDQGRERVLILGMMVADADYPVIASNDLFGSAMLQWIELLTPFMPDLEQWAERFVPTHKGPKHDLPHNRPVSVPKGTLLKAEISEDLDRGLRSEAIRRRDES